MVNKFKAKSITLPEGQVVVTIKSFEDGQTLMQGQKNVETCVITLQTHDNTIVKGYVSEEWDEGTALYNFIEALEEDVKMLNIDELDLEKYVGRQLIANVTKKKINGLLKCKVDSYMKL